MVFLENALGPIPFGGNRMMLFQIAFLESDSSVNDEFRFIAIAIEEADNAVACTNAFDDVLQHAVEQFFCRESLRAGCGQKSQTAKLCVEFFVSRARAFQDENDHGDAEGHAKQVVKSDAHEKIRAPRPVRAVNSMNCAKKKQSREEMFAIRLGGGMQQEPAGDHAQDTKQDGSFPANDAEAPRSGAFYIDQGEYGDD